MPSTRSAGTAGTRGSLPATGRGTTRGSRPAAHGRRKLRRELGRHVGAERAVLRRARRHGQRAAKRAGLHAWARLGRRQGRRLHRGRLAARRPLDVQGQPARLARRRRLLDGRRAVRERLGAGGLRRRARPTPSPARATSSAATRWRSTSVTSLRSQTRTRTRRHRPARFSSRPTSPLATQRGRGLRPTDSRPLRSRRWRTSSRARSTRRARWERPPASTGSASRGRRTTRSASRVPTSPPRPAPCSRASVQPSATPARRPTSGRRRVPPAWCTTAVDGAAFTTAWEGFSAWSVPALAFTSAPAAFVAGASAQLTVQLQTDGVAQNAGADESVTFSSTSPTAQFAAGPERAVDADARRHDPGRVVERLRVLHRRSAGTGDGHGGGREPPGRGAGRDGGASGPGGATLPGSGDDRAGTGAASRPEARRRATGARRIGAVAPGRPPSRRHRPGRPRLGRRAGARPSCSACARGRASSPPFRHGRTPAGSSSGRAARGCRRAATSSRRRSGRPRPPDAPSTRRGGR